MDKKKAIKLAIYCGITLTLVSLYFLFGLLLATGGGADGWNTFFGVDSAHYYDAFLNKDSVHYWRTEKHPFYGIFIYPVVWLLKQIAFSDIAAVMLTQAIAATACVWLVYFILRTITKRLGGHGIFIYILTTILVFSFSVLVFASVVDVYIFGMLSLLIFWAYFCKKYKTQLEKRDYAILIILGVVCMSMTLTNFLQFIIGASFLVVFNEKKTREKFWPDVWKYCVMMIYILTIATALSVFQMIVFPYAKLWPMHLADIIREIFAGEGLEYIDNPWGLQFMKIPTLATILWGIVSFFGIAFVAPPLVRDQNWRVNRWARDGYHGEGEFIPTFNAFHWVVFAIFAAILIYALINIIRQKRFSFALPFIVTMVVQFVFNSLYSFDEAFLFSAHFVFLPIIFLGISAPHLKFRKKPTDISNLVFTGALIVYALILIVSNISAMSFIVGEVFKTVYEINVAANFFVTIAMFLVTVLLGVCGFIAYLFIRDKYKKKDNASS